MAMSVGGRVSGGYRCTGIGSIGSDSWVYECLKTVDVSDPTRPQAVGDLQVSFHPIGEARGNRAFVSALMTFLVVDISDLSRPTTIGWHYWPTSYGSNGGVHRVALHGDLVWTSEAHGVRVVDVQDHTRPRIIGDLRLTWNAFALDIAGGTVYVGADGIWMFDPDATYDP